MFNIFTKNFMITPIEALKYFKGGIDWITTGLDVQYYIEKDNEGNVVIAFQGSNSKLDWKQNFKFWKKPYKNMEVKFRVHSGFLEIWKSCRDEIMDRLEEMKPTSVTVVGHSLGGAISILCTEDCDFRFRKTGKLSQDKLQCITFGAPRVIGFLHFKKIKDRWNGTRLFNNSSDIVPCVPPFFFLYRHVTEQIHIGKLRHWWDFFRPDKYHMINGEEGYGNSLRKISE